MNEKVTWLLEILSYMLTPENSEIFISGKANYQKFGNMPEYLGKMKAAFWIVIALFFSLAISKLN